MRRLLRCAGWALCLAAGTAVFAAEAANAPADPAADRATEAFQRLYGNDLARVRGTADLKDDVALAERLLAAARQATGTPALLAVLCDHAYDLASGHPDGCAVALESAEFLASQAPDRAALCAERVADIRQRQYAHASGKPKAVAGETLIDALLVLVDAHVAAGDHPQAVAACRKAGGIARAVESPRLAAIEARRRRVTRLLQVRRDIRDMRALLERDPANTAARERLVRLHLVGLDDPAEAARHLEGVEDAGLKKYVPAAARGLAAAPELACVELGDWYRTLGESADASVKAAMFARARAYYDRFLALHPAEDLDRAAAALALRKVETQLAKLAEAGNVPVTPVPGGETAAPKPTETAAIPAGGTIKPGTWVDLLPLAAPAKHAVKGKWEQRAGSLALVEDLGAARLMLPVVPLGSYELEVVGHRTWGDSTLVVILPVANRGVTVSLDYDHSSASGLDQVGGKPPDKNETRVAPSRVGKRDHTVHVTVEVMGQAGRVRVMFDGQPHIDWKGPLSALSVPQKWTLPVPQAIGLGAFFSRARFSRVRLKMLTGQARVLRPANP